MKLNVQIRNGIQRYSGNSILYIVGGLLLLTIDTVSGLCRVKNKTMFCAYRRLAYSGEATKTLLQKNMKKVALKTVAILLIMLISFACNNDEANNNMICDCNNKVNSIELTDLEGTIYFNEDIQKWYISSIPKEGTYDEALLYIPCNMKEEYKKVNEKVRFSGTVFDLSAGLDNIPAGSGYTCIEISSLIYQK